MPSLSSIADFLAAALSPVAARVVEVVLVPGKVSLASLVVAGCLAVFYIGMRRKDRARPLRFRVLMRALFPRRIVRSRSARADIVFTLINLFVVGSFLGIGVLSYLFVTHGVTHALVSVFGPQPVRLPDFAAACAMTGALFLAFELGYWIDHYLSHNVPFLWEFHKVHHSAEVLTPLTDFRVHPVDTLVFNNVLAAVMGMTAGVMTFALGRDAQPFTFANSNVLTLLFAYALMHLQHSHLWIAFTGVWGRLLLSPAHHQLHHSTDPAHFNKNLGSFIGVWDWLFGTLLVPERKRQKLVFGVDPVAETRHTMREGFIAPFARAFAISGLAQAVQEVIDDGGDETPAAGAPSLVSLKAAE